MNMIVEIASFITRYTQRD